MHPSPPIIASVVLNLSLDKEFDYRIPPALLGRIEIGSRVRVPFGNGREPRSGFVVGLKHHSDYGELKEIETPEAEKEQIPAELLKLARWMADYYCCPYEKAVVVLLPASVRSGRVGHRRQLFIGLAPGIDPKLTAAEIEKKSPRQAQVLLTLERTGGCTASRLCHLSGIDNSVLRAMEKKGLVTLEEEVVERDPFAGDTIIPDSPKKLTSDQARIMPPLLEAQELRKHRTFLLHGVTGSGKTEVYLQAIARCLELGREAIVLVPEISLTPQTVERFRARFGDRVSVLHSGLSDGERFDEWVKINEGRAPIVVGARSALFAPMRRLGLIIVDEEHDSSYKQDEAPRYHARDAAVYRGRLDQAVVLLGSATPSLESYANAESGKYELLRLPVRVDDQIMPEVELVDMRSGSPGIFSRRLETAIRGRLEAGDQVILFLNRRGYATQFLCSACGYIAKCEHCAPLPYTYHRKSGQLCCHVCGEVATAPAACPQCGSTEVKFTGIGTEKVESLAKSLFPNARIARMDADTTAGRHAHRDILDAFKAHKYDLLIGTQMIAKGLHFPKVTLVGVINADMALHLPDFRAAERTFCLLTQVAGRAGRGDRPGLVIIQTYSINHSALQFAIQHDYEGFYREEIVMRRELKFPPEGHMVIVHFRGEDCDLTEKVARQFADLVAPHLPEGVISGEPVPAQVAKKKDLYRYHLTFRGGPALKLIGLLRQAIFKRKFDRKVAIYIDVDPQNLL
jgi:primosomal protein N' (replication factor Y)